MKHLSIQESSVACRVSDGDPRARLRSSAQRVALEPRMLFDGAALATVDAHHDNDTAALSDGPDWVDTRLDPAIAEGPRELLVVDPAIQGWESLVQSRAANVDVLILDSSSDAVGQIVDAVEASPGLGAIHIVTHGEEGRVVLAGQVLDAESLAEYEEPFAQIGAGLSAGGDLVFYACDLAAGSSGQAFVQALANAAGVEVVASTDTTGLNGDWNLEYASDGSVEARLFADVTALSESTASLDLAYASSVSTRWVSTDQAHTAGVSVAIGEVVTWETTVTVPTGLSQNAHLDVNLDAGLGFVEVVGTTVSGGVSTQRSDLTVAPTASGFRLDFGNLNNADANTSTHETLTVRYTTVVLNTGGNFAGASLAPRATLTADNRGTTNVALVDQTVSVVEPELTVTVTGGAVGGVVDSGDLVTFQCTIRNTSAVTAYDLNVPPLQLPIGMVFDSNLSLEGATGASGLTVDGVARTASIASLSANGEVVFSVQARVTNAAQFLAEMVATETITWSSLPGSVTDRGIASLTTDAERTGAGGAPNDYLAAGQCYVYVPSVVPELSIVRTSDANTREDLSNRPNVGVDGVEASVGEIVRMRMVVDFAEAGSADLVVRPNFPSDLAFLNDGSTTIALVSDNPFTVSADLAGAQVTGSSESSVATHVLSSARITDPSGVALSTGEVTFTGHPNQLVYTTQTDPTTPDVRIPSNYASGPFFRLGDVRNNDNDTQSGALTGNREFIIIEFNAVVKNAQGVQDALNQPVRFDVMNGQNQLMFSNSAYMRVVEPQLSTLSKVVTASDGQTITYQVSFANTGSAVAHDVLLTDPFSGQSDLRFDRVLSIQTLAGVATTQDTSDSGTMRVTVNALNPTDQVVVTYQATLLNPVAVAERPAILTWSSLPQSGERLSVTTSGGVVQSSTTGERTGVPGSTLNDYILTESAGLGLISGRLWDDTNLPNNAWDSGSGELPVANATVTLEWFPPGSSNPLPTGRLTATTDANGVYRFAGLPVTPTGVALRISVTNGVSADLALRWDAQGNSRDGAQIYNLSEGLAVTSADFAYVQYNDAPVNTVPSLVNAAEDDAAVSIPVSVSDVDAGAKVMRVTLSLETAGAGLLRVTPPSGSSVTGTFSGTTLTLEGSQTALNAVIGTLQYVPTADLNGDVTLRMVSNDYAGTGDSRADGDGIPNERSTSGTPQDELEDADVITVRLAAVNDPPLAQLDTNRVSADRVLAATGNVLTNDSDPEGDRLTVTGLSSVAGGTGAVGAVLNGQHGRVTINADGTYSYLLNNTDPAVQALRIGQTLTDTFAYQISDGNGGQASSQLIITIDGINDPPVAVVDRNQTLSTSTIPLTGNVLTNDSDPDGDPLQLTSSASMISGQYGVVVIGGNGGYSYVLNNDHPSVKPLRAGETLTETFDYQITDGQGGTSQSQLIITIEGVNQPPVAADDLRNIAANDATPLVGSVLGNDSDANNDILTVTEIRTVAGQSGTIGVALPGQYGQVILNADGGYRYVLDNTHPDVIALAPGQTLTETYNYAISDGYGGTASARLIITITGLNEPPLAVTDRNSIAANATAPVSGNVLPNDTDPESDPLLVTGLSKPAGVAGSLGVSLAGDYGTVLLNADGTYAYTVSNANPTVLALKPAETLTDTFDYTISDGRGGTSAAQLVITITGVNEAPSAQGVTVTVPYGSVDNSVPIAVPTDPDHPLTDLTVTVVELPAGGTLTLDGQPLAVGQVIPADRVDELRYTPNPNLATPVRADGTQDGGRWVFTVSDGLVASGPVESNFNVLPAPISPSGVPDRPEFPDGLDPVVLPGITTPVVDPAVPLGFSAASFAPSLAPTLDAGGLLPVVAGESGEIEEAPVAKKAVLASPLVRSAQAECEQESIRQPNKPKPKTFVKRPSLLGESATKDQSAASFSQEIKKAVKKFKPPVKVKPRVSAREC